MMALFVFVVAAAMVVGGGVGVILSKHPVHSDRKSTRLNSSH